MNLMGQEYEEKDQKLKKILKISIIVAIILFFVVLGVMMYFYYLESQQLKMYINQERTAIADDLLIFDQNTGKIYISIEDMAKIAGYEYYKGEYQLFTEEQTKCYIDNKNEVAGFELGSNQLYKADSTEQNQNYEWYTMEEPVKVINGKLYCVSTGIETACNIDFSYNIEKNRIEIFTLPYLFDLYQSIVINNYGYAGIDTNYMNKKTLLYDMIVVKKQEDKDTFKYGVITLDNKQVIGTKYDNIEFMEVSKEFFVTSSNKVGILSSEGAQKIEPNYDEIKILDNDLRLYYVVNNDIKGVLDRNGKRIVYLEYNQIGVDTTLFPSDKIKNNMLLYDNCIPVMKNEKWGIFDKNGNLIVNTVYDSLGYIQGTKKDNSINNVLLIPSVEGIVVGRDGKYGIVNSTGKYIAPCSFDRIYSITNLGEEKYYLEYNGGQTITIEDYIKLNGSQVQTQGSNNQTNTVDNTTTNTTNPIEQLNTNSTITQ